MTTEWVLISIECIAVLSIIINAELYFRRTYGKAALMHHYYHSVEGNTDLAAIREQANQRTKLGNKYNSKPEDSVIHFHRFGDACDGTTQHEFYTVPPLTATEASTIFWDVKLEEKK